MLDPGGTKLGEFALGVKRGVQVLVTLQNVAQLREGHGPDAAEAILSGFLSALILRCGDEASVNFARERIGTEFVERTSHVEKATVGSRHRRRQKAMRRETRQDQEFAFSRGDLTPWEPGVGVVVHPDSWAHGRVPVEVERGELLDEPLAVEGGQIDGTAAYSPSPSWCSSAS